MEALDLVIQNNASSGVKPLITLAIFSILGSFFIAELITSVMGELRRRVGVSLNLKKNRINN